MFGAALHAGTNALINRMAAVSRPLVVSHGGAAVGPFPSNTAASVRAALLSGADAVKIDVSSSIDNIFYAFHDGFEEELLGESRNIQSLPASDIAQLSYRWKNRPGRRAHVERLLTLLTDFRDQEVLFALDRSWWRWPTLLRVLDGVQMTQQVVLKVPGWEHAALDQLREHRTPYPALAICSTEAEVAALPLHDRGINLVGVELIAHDAESPWFDPCVIDDLHDQGLLVWVNSETLTTGVPLFGGYDDERCLTQGPDAAWAPLLHLGVDAVQTELPWLLAQLRAQHLGCEQPELPLDEHALESLRG